MEITFNQQYYLMVEYDFIGPYQLGHMHQDEVMEDFSGKTAGRLFRQPAALQPEGKR